jgi:hypothetical protein
MVNLKKIFILSFCFFFINGLMAQVSPYEVQANNPLRKTILSTIRTPTTAELGQKIEFVVDIMMSKGNWTFVSGQLQQVGGKALDKTKFVDKNYLKRGKEGLFDNNFQALLQKKKGKWVIVKRELGCTDVCWLAWRNSVKGVEDAIFPQ